MSTINDKPASFINYAHPAAHEPTATSLSLGEEGGSQESRVSTEAVGEEGGGVRAPRDTLQPGLTTFAVGEESGSRVSTEAVGEEGGGISAPAKKTVTPQTESAIEELRTSEIPYEAVLSQIASTLAKDPAIRETLSAKKIGDLALRLLAFENRDASAGQVIASFIDANAAKPQSPLATRVSSQATPAAAPKPTLYIGEAKGSPVMGVSNVRIEGDDVVFTARFGGGFVKDHDINIFWDGTVLESLPVQFPMKVTDQTLDPAEAIKSQEVRVSLAPLQVASGETVILHLNDSTVTYTGA